VNGARQRDGQLGPLEILVLGAAAGVLLVQGGLWLWTGTAGALFGSGWPHLTLDTLWHAIAGVARHLSNPRQGFPARTRLQLPGATGFYAALALLILALTLIAAATTWLWQRTKPAGAAGSKRHGARWAGGSDLARLRRARHRRRSAGAAENDRQSDPRMLGMSLGYRGMRLLRAEDRHALVVFGPTQSGKSAGLAIPNILEWSGPAIVVSIKPDLLDATITAQADRGEVLV
jgi:type IV secretion system protein VirD4